MAIIVCYDPSDTVVANRVIEFNWSAHGPNYSGEPNKLENPDLSLLWAAPDTFLVPQKYWKYDGVGDIVEMPAGEKQDIDESYITSTPFGDSSTVENTCKNTSGVLIPAGTPIYISGIDANTNVPTMAKAEASNAAKMPAIGMVKYDVGDGEYGTVVRLGVINGLDTSGSSVNDYVYVSGAGGFSSTPPSTEGDVHQRLGQIIKVGVSSGIVLVFTHDSADTNWLGGIEVDYAAKADDYALAYDSASNKITFQDLNASGSTSATISSWTPSSGDLYYGDFAHGLETTDISVFCVNTVTDKKVDAEDIEVLNVNSVRVWVRGNSHSIKVNVVAGRGPVGPAGADGADGADGLASVADDPTPELSGNLVLGIRTVEYSVPQSSGQFSGESVLATVDSNAYGNGAAMSMSADGTFDNSDADVDSPCRALATTNGTGTIRLLLKGFYHMSSWSWTAGQDLYVSNTPGELTHTAPTGAGDFIQKVGFAWSSSVIYFDPGLAVVEHA